MKKTFTLLFIAAFTGNPATSQDIVTEANTSAIYETFSASLSEKEVSFNETTTIPMEQIATTRDKVWSIWKSAVENFDEEKLFEVTELEKREKSSWKLPAHLEANATMPFYWGCNAVEVEPDTKYPLFLYMHGSGDKNQEWETGIGLSLRRFYSPGIYFVPQIPNATGEYYRWATRSKQWAWEKLLRLAFLTDEVDANKIYFFGISEGAYGSQRLAAFYADYLAGAGPMAGGEPLRNAPMENVANIAFSLRTGELDDGFSRNELTQKALEVADELQKQHPGYYNHFIEVIEGDGHSIDYRPTTPWLAEYTRDPHPDYFFWENYDMYGGRRTGFYNLRVIEPSLTNDNQGRACYEMNRDGNTVTLDVKKVTYTTDYAEPKYGIEIDFTKKYETITKGKVRLYLNEKEYDLTQPVKVVLNGTEIFNGMVGTNLKTMVESCAYYFDPERLFPAAIDIDIEEMSAAPTTSIVTATAPHNTATSTAIYGLGGRQVQDIHEGGIYISQGHTVLVKE
ncbi:MAG: hypothetical protein IKJ18_09010 [Bacteroidaceae bacterium]|nr:hypothetical protein [Bacteroidaceae bacterium]